MSTAGGIRHEYRDRVTDALYFTSVLQSSPDKNDSLVWYDTVGATRTFSIFAVVHHFISPIASDPADAEGPAPTDCQCHVVVKVTETT